MEDGHDEELDTFQPIGLAAARVVKSISTSVSAKGFDLGNSVSSVGILSAGEAPERDLLAFNSDRSAPFVARCVVEDAAESGLVELSAVGLVLGAAGFPNVTQPIIGRVSVSVVDVTSGPTAMDMKPSQPVSEVGSATNDDGATTALVNGAGDPPDKMGDMICRRYPPAKLAGQGIVINQPTQLICCDQGVIWNRLGHFEFQTLLIANRLKTERQIREHNREDGNELRGNSSDEDEARRKLALVNRRLADLAEFERRAGGKRNKV
jgi:hypothetical protein